MVQGCWLVLRELFLQALLTSRGPDGGLRVAPSHGSLTRGDRAYGSGAGRPGTASWNGAACSGACTHLQVVKATGLPVLPDRRYRVTRSTTVVAFAGADFAELPDLISESPLVL